MTEFDYSRAKETAERLIARFGRRAYLRKAGTETDDDWNPTQTSPTDWQITVVELRDTKTGVADINGAPTLVTASGVRLLISTAGLDLVTVEKADAIMLGTGTEIYPEQMTRHEIAAVRPLSPGDTVILWEVDLKA